MRRPLLQRIQIQRFRNIEFADAALGTVNVIIAPNGMGKTNLLAAVAALFPTVCAAEIERFSENFGEVGLGSVCEQFLTDRPGGRSTIVTGVTNRVLSASRLL